MQPLLLGAGLTLGLASPLAAQCGAQKVLPIVYEAGAQFGSSLTFVKGGMAVGAWLSSVFAPQGGAVFLAEGAPGSFTIAVPLGPADASSGQRFGRAVDGAVKWLAVGADGDGTLGPDAGAAYLFELTPYGPAERAKLLAADGGSEDLFGRAIAMHGPRVLVGAPGHGAAVQNAGAAYVFVNGPQGWVEEARLEPVIATPFASFGRAVALVAGVAFVGAPNADRVHVFKYEASGWVEIQIIKPSAGGFTGFGVSLAATATRLVVGASDPSGTGPGRAYVYEQVGGAWIEKAVLTSPDGSPGDRFGAAVALSGAEILVGAPDAEGACPSGPNCNTGAAWLFRKSGPSWVPETALVPCATDVGSQVGTGVALEAGVVLLGTSGSATPHDKIGGAVWSYAQPLPGAPTLTAVPAQYSLFSGMPQTLSLEAGAANAGRYYLFLGSTTQATGGIPLGSVSVPLGLGPYFLITLTNPLSQPLSQPLGILGGQGQATVTFALTPSMAPSLTGTTLWHSVVVFDLVGGFAPDFASNAVPAALVP